MWQKIKQSWTMISMAVVSMISFSLDNFDVIASADLKSQLTEAGFDPVTAGRTGLVISFIAMIARMKSIVKKDV